MNDELEKKLVEKYPKLYAQYGGDMRQTCMAWGMSCGDGWFKIIEELSEKLSKFEGVEAAQVKEKFGGLRFYVDGTTQENYKEVHKIISEYEALSYKTCENCGEVGEVRKGGWVRTLCDKCENERVTRLK